MINHTGHIGMPGPGGSMGQCAVCGDTFMKEILLDLVGHGESGNIAPFTLNYVNETLYAHVPDCVATLEAAFKAAEKEKRGFKYSSTIFHDKLPDGPLKKALRKAIDEGESKRPWE